MDVSGLDIEDSARLSQGASLLTVSFDVIEGVVATASKFRYVDKYAVRPKLPTPVTFQDLLADLRETAALQGLEQFGSLVKAENQLR